LRIGIDFSAIHGKTAPKRGGVSKIPRQRSCSEHLLLTCGFCMKTLPELYLYHDSDCSSCACQFLVRSFSREESIVSIGYIILGGGLQKCYVMLHRVGGWCEKDDFCVIYMNGPLDAEVGRLTMGCRQSVMTLNRKIRRRCSRHTDAYAVHRSQTDVVVAGM